VAAPRRFPTTRWSVIVAAGQESGLEGRQALSELCERYWDPVYAFVVRRGYAPDKARDLTQGFFLALLEKNSVAGADRARGRFRSWLIGAAKNYLANEWDKARAQKRGGGEAPAPLDAEPAGGETPEVAYDRAWASSVVDRAKRRLFEEETAKGNGDFLEQVHEILGDRGDEAIYERLAGELRITPNAVKTRVSRLRTRLRALMRMEIADTVDGEEIEDEIRELIRCLGGASGAPW
jgi:DNA-directed RNA polymerase specialized sigma24 family protein